MSGFNTFDLLAVVLLLAAGILAFRRGFVKEVFMLGTWIGASVIAANYYAALTPWVMSHDIKNQLAAEAISAIAIFGLALLALIPTGNLLAGLIKGPTLTSIDRSLGFVFGLLKGLLILCLVFLVLSFIWPKDDEQPTWLNEAKIKPLLADGADMLKSFVPEDSRQQLEDEVNKKREAAAENAQRLQEMTTPEPAWDDKTSDEVPDSGEEVREKTDDIFDQ
jgi:membrane protein required for colicin V production